jgi:carbamoyl-phosphate synthase large subunit
VQIAVSSADFVGICRDKRKTSPWFASRGLTAPRVVNGRAATDFPIFAKPYNGSCGQDARVVALPSELTPKLLDDPRMMFVEYLSPAEHDEYTIDMYYSRDGKLRCLVPRLRIETRAGEVSKSRTARIDAIDTLRDRLGSVDGARGCITLQIFVNRHSNAIYGIEINPRFGGGYPLSYEAGANFPRWLIEEYLWEKPVEFCDDWESELTMLRYDDHVVVRGTAA